MKFTGHERDLADPSGTGDDLDYMHARYCSPLTAKFTSIDPINSANPKRPQSWNRYVYSENSPLTFVDPTGEVVAPSFVSARMKRNTRLRERIKEMIESSNGGILAFVADSLLGSIAPADAPEANAFLLGMVAPLGGKSGTGRVSSEIVEETGEIAAGRGASGGVRAAQKSVSSTFRHGEFAGKTIDEVASGLRSGAISPDRLPLQTITRDGITYTLNNRSWVALREAGLAPTILKDVTGNAFFERQLTQRLKELGGHVGPDFVPKIRGGNQ